MRDDAPIPNFGTSANNPTPGMINSLARLVEQTFRNFAAVGRASFSTINIRPLDLASLPQRANEGDVSYAKDEGTGSLMFFDGDNWVPVSGGGGGGGGDVFGPNVAEDGNIAIFSGSTGKVIADSGVSPSDFALAAELQALRQSFAGQIAAFPRTTPPPGWLVADGSAVEVSTYPYLTNSIYCGDANNSSAPFGYRCTNANNPDGTRSTSGGYIVLPDLRGEFLRALDLGRGLDPDRKSVV